LQETALREAEEEIGLNRDDVRILGGLEAVSTFVTGYLIHPFVGLIPASRAWTLSPNEVESVLEFSLRDLLDSRTKTTLERRGFTFETDAYILDGHLIWGATARILESLLDRITPLLEPSAA
jgi:8-oxo-dGTP pyrophosphatase MutT (NUDIX family)